MKKLLSVSVAITTILWLVGVAYIPVATAATIVEGDVVSPNATYTDADGNTYYPYDVFIIKYVGTKKFKRLVLNPEVFASYGHLKWSNIKTVTVDEVKAFTTSSLVRAIGDTKVYKLIPDGDTGTKKWVETLDCFTSQGYDWDSVYIINNTDRDNYTTGAGICGGGELNASLASDTPVAATIPATATNISFLKVVFTGTGTINSLSITRSGVGATADITDVYLYDGETRLTSGRSVSTATNKAIFNNLGLAVSGSRTITVIGEVDGDAGNTHYFSIAAASDVSASVTVGGTFPITGKIMALAAQTSGTLTINGVGSIADPNVGANQAEVSEFTLSASTENIKVTSLNLYNAGTIDMTDITNLKLKKGDTVVATGTGCTSGGYCLLTFSGSGYTVVKGTTDTFRLYADLAGRPSKNIILYLDTDTDIRAVGESYGGGPQITRTDFDSSTAGEAHTLTLQGGELTLTFDNPVAANVSTDTNDTVMLNFSMTAATALEIKKMRLYICWDNAGGGGATAATAKTEVEDVKIKNKDTGLALMGPTDGSSFTSAEDGSLAVCTEATYEGEWYKEWTDTFDIAAGEKLNLQATMDIKANTYLDATDGLLALLYGFVNLTNPVKYQATNDYVAAADIVPNTNQLGNTMTLQTSSLSVALGALPVGNVDAVKGQTLVTAESFVFTAAQASDMTLTDLTLNAWVSETSADYTVGKMAGGLYAKNVLSKVYLYEDNGTTLIKGPEGFSGTNYKDVVFTGLSWSVPAGSSKKILVKVDISSEATSATVAQPYDFVYFDIDATTNITATDKLGSTYNSSTSNLVTEDTPEVRVRKADGGTLTLAAAPAGIIPETTYVYQGQTNAVFSKFKFTTTLEAFTVDKLTIDLLKNTASTSNISQVTLEYPKDAAGTLETKSAPFGGTASLTFSNLNFFIPKNDYAYLTVKADLSTFDDVGDESGDAMSLDFDSTLAADFNALGQGSNIKITGTNANIGNSAGSDMRLVRNFPSFAKLGPTSSSGTSLPETVLQFKLTNNGNYEMFFNDGSAVGVASGSIEFWVAASGTSGSFPKFALYDENNTMLASCASAASLASTSKAGGASVSFNFDQQALTIPKNTSKTLTVKIVSGRTWASANGDYIQFKLLNNSNEIYWVDGSGQGSIGYTASTKGIGIPMDGPEFTIAGF